MTRNQKRALEFGGFGVASVALYALILPIASIRRTQSCQSNLKQIGLAMIQYVRDYDETWVLPNDWQTKIAPYTPKERNVFQCPETQNSYALNRWIAGHPMAQFSNNAKTPMAFEANSAQNQPCDGGILWPATGVHFDYRNRTHQNSIAWLDGHVTLIPAAPKPVFKPR